MRNKKGEGYVSTCVMIVVICMLLSVFVTFAVAVNTVKTVERNSRVVLDSFVTVSYTHLTLPTKA